MTLPKVPYTHMAIILLIDDSEDTGLLVRHAMAPHDVDHAQTLAEAEALLAQTKQYDLLLIDVSLPDGNGFDFCQKLESNTQFLNTPKFLLTASDQMSEKVYGFGCGADDYITKPFNEMELKARVDRHLKRRNLLGGGGLNSFVNGCFEFDLEFQKCYLRDDERVQDLELTPTEFRLFLLLAKNEDRVMSRLELERTLWRDLGATIEVKGIDTHIAHLRRKLGPLKDVIVSVYGQGYSYKPASARSRTA